MDGDAAVLSFELTGCFFFCNEADENEQSDGGIGQQKQVLMITGGNVSDNDKLVEWDDVQLKFGFSGIEKQWMIGNEALTNL